jgi:hypothetical protein
MAITEGGEDDNLSSYSNEEMKMIVYETNQFTAIDVLEAELTVQDFDRINQQDAGAHADMVRKMFGAGRLRKLEVSDIGYPDKGYVWFQPEEETGILRQKAANFDTSD